MLFSSIWRVILLSFTIILLTFLCFFYFYTRNLPDYVQLANYYPPCVTRVYSSEGKLIEEYALEHRIFVPFDSIPKIVVKAFIAAEDKNFFNHSGFDLHSLLRVALSSIPNLLSNKRVAGGSTITQQVVKNLLLTPERSIERKVKELILSYMISKTFTKEQILELYLNQSYLGLNSYGIVVAAQRYFNKSLHELTLAEVAFLAGLPKAPTIFNPRKNYQKAKERRDYVIRRMLKNNYVSKEEAEKALSSEIVLYKRDKELTVKAPYYAEKVRKLLIERFGEKLLYTGGLTVITPLNEEYQKFAEEALHNGICNYDKRRGYRGPLARIKLDNWHSNLLGIKVGDKLLEYNLAVVLKTDVDSNKIGLIDGSYGVLKAKNCQWALGEKTFKSLFSVGDVIEVEYVNQEYLLRQVPEVNGAIMVMDPRNGQVMAMVGGYNYNDSKFDRATQAIRYPGSLIKPFVYLAALEQGIQPNAIFEDTPIEVEQGPNLPLWKPKNYDNNFWGPVTMRTGLEKSRNIVTIKVAQESGLQHVSEIINRFGINTTKPKFFISLVLGAVETTLEKMTNAYSMIVNGGYQIRPEFIELIQDRYGRVIYRGDRRGCYDCKVDNTRSNLPKVSYFPRIPLTDSGSAYQLISMMLGAVERGTARGIKKLGSNVIIGGKTGTTNDSKDSWCITFTSNLVVGAYIGYDNPKSLGDRENGATVALPVVFNFMKHVLPKRPSLPFKVPSNIQLVKVDPLDGLPTNSVYNSITEAIKINSGIKIPFSGSRDLGPRSDGIENMQKNDVFDVAPDL